MMLCAKLCQTNHAMLTLVARCSLHHATPSAIVHTALFPDHQPLTVFNRFHGSPRNTYAACMAAHTPTSQPTPYCGIWTWEGVQESEIAFIPGSIWMAVTTSMKFTSVVFHNDVWCHVANAYKSQTKHVSQTQNPKGGAV